MTETLDDYVNGLHVALNTADTNSISILEQELKNSWKAKNRIFVCGNGGSAANAVHIANDLTYGVTKKLGQGLNISALPADLAIMTCLANDEGYDKVFSHQLRVQGSKGNILIALSGSGNSDNIINALKAAKEIGMKTFGVLGFDGGKAKVLCDVPIHFNVDNMQISEDLQIVLFHYLTRRLGCITSLERILGE